MKIAIIGGGPSREAEISRLSAEQVRRGFSKSHITEYFEFDQDLTANLLNFKPDVAFPVMHGSPGEDGVIQAFLSVLSIPYVGSDFLSSAKAIDKFNSKCIWENWGIPVLPTIVVSKTSFSDDVVERVEEKFQSQVAIKPCNQGSALGVQLLPDGGEIAQAINQAFEYGDTLIVEPYIRGREITVAVLEDESGCRALPVIEVKVTNPSEWYDFTNRYSEGKSQHVVNPPMAKEADQSLKDIAVRAHQVLGCRDLSRADFIVTEEEDIWLLELNTMPGMTKTSLFPDAAKADGIEFTHLLDGLVSRAQSRGPN